MFAIYVSEIHEGLNMVESWNRANAVIFYGKGGDLASNHRDEQEMSLLCLRILQAALVYVNTLMFQDLLAEPEGASGWGSPYGHCSARSPTVHNR
jgi:TnpA family transposase